MNNVKVVRNNKINGINVYSNLSMYLHPTCSGPPFVVGFVADDPDVKARSPDVLGAMTDNCVVFTANFEASDTVGVGILANVAAGFPNGVGVTTNPPNASHF